MRKHDRRLASLLLLGAFGCRVPEAVAPQEKTAPMACSQEAKVCADGTIVSRTGPECEFTECPDARTPTNGLTPDPAPEPATGSTNPQPMGTFTDPEPPPG
jgi:hypothetical protein